MPLPHLSSLNSQSVLQSDCPLRPSRAHTFADSLSSAVTSKDVNVGNNGFETTKVTNVTSSSTFTKSIGSIFSTINKSVSSAFSSLISVPDATAQTDCTRRVSEVKPVQMVATSLSADDAALNQMANSDANTPLLMSSAAVSSSQVPSSHLCHLPSQLPSSSVPLMDMAPAAVGKSLQDDHCLKKINKSQLSNSSRIKHVCRLISFLLGSLH